MHSVCPSVSMCVSYLHFAVTGADELKAWDAFLSADHTHVLRVLAVGHAKAI